jgi:geranylgeranyl diphosphate synthase, type II
MTRKFNFKQYVANRQKLINKALDSYFATKKNQLTAKLLEAIRYSLLSSGKRLRPMLCLASAEAVNGDIKTVMPVALALEMIHAASLIHDDLPAMDNDDFRRGIPTNHKVYGEAMAILAGDALIVEAFKALANVQNIAPKKIAKAIWLVADATGANGMIGGQAVEMVAGRDDLVTIDFVNRLKTASLIAVSCEVGALLGGGSAKTVAALKKYGIALGMAFQMFDDIVDMASDQNLKTYPQIVGKDETYNLAKQYILDAINAIEFLRDRADPLINMARHFL